MAPVSAMPLSARNSPVRKSYFAPRRTCGRSERSSGSMRFSFSCWMSAIEQGKRISRPSFRPCPSKCCRPLLNCPLRTASATSGMAARYPDSAKFSGVAIASSVTAIVAALRTHLPQRCDFQGVKMIADRACDKARGDRCAVVMQDRYEPHRIDIAFVDDQRAQLAVAVLLDHEHEVVLGDEIRNVLVEGEATHPQHVERLTARRHHVDRLVHRGGGRAEINRAVAYALIALGIAAHRPRHQPLRGLELAQEALHVIGVGPAFLGVACVAVARG